MNEQNWIPSIIAPKTSRRYIVACGSDVFEARFIQGCGWSTLRDGNPIVPDFYQSLPEPPSKPDAFEEFCKAHNQPNMPQIVSIQGCQFVKSDIRPIFEAGFKAGIESIETKP